MSSPTLAKRARATEVRHVREQSLLRITWSDGHIGDYAYEYLRGWCPCAACQGHGNTRRFISVPAVQLTGIEAVGNYALQFTWTDGHDTGIYSYRYLRDLCPCATCITARDQGEGSGR